MPSTVPAFLQTQLAQQSMSAAMSTPMVNTQQKEYAANAAQADAEGADYQAQANADSANKTNALAQTLAQARNSTPGGGIRMGIQNGALSANSATSGLTAANAAGRVARRKTQLNAATDATLAQQQQAKYEANMAALRQNAFSQPTGVVWSGLT